MSEFETGASPASPTRHVKGKGTPIGESIREAFGFIYRRLEFRDGSVRESWHRRKPALRIK